MICRREDEAMSIASVQLMNKKNDSIDKWGQVFDEMQVELVRKSQVVNW